MRVTGTIGLTLALLLAAPLTGAAADHDCKLTSLPASPPPPEGDRTMVFVSDLHMGVGIDPKTKDWHPTEDFRWHAEFHAFLKQLQSDDGGTLDLVLLGDVFELWQEIAPTEPPKTPGEKPVAKPRCVHGDANLGCTREEILARLDVVLREHQAFFDAVDWLLQQDEGNRVTFVPGNHDAALVLDEVAERVLGKFSKKEQVHVAQEGYWMSRDGLVFAEHGHQIGADPNCFKGWPGGVLVEGGAHLRKTWGEQMVQDLFNRYEEKYPTIDNLSEEVAGVRFAVQEEGFDGALLALGRVIRFVFTQTSWEQTKQLLGEDGIPVWKTQETLASLDTSEARWAFLLASLAKDDPLRKVFEGKAPSELPQLVAFSEQEVEAICDRRWVRRKVDPDSGIEDCAGTGKLGAVAERVGDLVHSGAKDERFVAYLGSVQSALPEGDRPTRNFQGFVFGHTHKEVADYAPFEAGGWRPVVFNDGAWQRTATPEVWCTEAKKRKFEEKEAMSLMRPEHLPACYPYVVGYVGKKGELNLNQQYWVQEKGEPGSIQPTCGLISTIDPACVDD